MPPSTNHYSASREYRATAIIQALSNTVTQNDIGNLLVLACGRKKSLLRGAVSGFAVSCIACWDKNMQLRFVIIQRVQVLYSEIPHSLSPCSRLRLWMSQMSSIRVKRGCKLPSDNAICYHVSFAEHHHPSHQIRLEVQSNGDKTSRQPGFHATTPRWRPRAPGFILLFDSWSPSHRSCVTTCADPTSIPRNSHASPANPRLSYPLDLYEDLCCVTTQLIHMEW